jgi:hypothetical protein
MEFNQDHFLADITPELPKANSNSKRIVATKELIMHIDNSMCHNGRLGRQIDRHLAAR